VLCVSSYTSRDSLENRFVPFQLAITLCKIFEFTLKASLSRFLIIHIKRNSETPFTIRLNQQQSAVCTPLYKKRRFKHQKFDQPFEIKAQSMRVKTTKISWRRKRSDHKLWKRKWVFLGLQKRCQI